MYKDNFFFYLENDKKMSKSSLDAYTRDVEEYYRFCESRNVDVIESTNTEIVAFLMDLKDKGRTTSTINRKVASVRAFFRYLFDINVVQNDPTKSIKTPKIERKVIEYLTIEEVDVLLGTPNDSPKGLRDKAILEILYATGMRVNELIAANIDDVNLRIGFFTSPGDAGKARIVPIGRPARVALENYLFDIRDKFIKEDDDEKALFVNYNGKRMTRQGLWKILKGYGVKAGLNKKITPHILRNSFAVHMVQNGADLKSLQELLGHEELAATQIYLSVTKNRIKDVYDKTHPRA